MALPRTALDHWAVLAAVVDHGGFAQAASVLNKSQSAVSYAVARLQDALDVPLLVIEGRRAVLTAHGATLLQRARALQRDAATLEALAASLKQGWEPELRLVVDAAYPRAALLAVLAELDRRCPQTQIRLADAVLSGAEEAIADGLADLVVTSRVPPQALGEFLLAVDFVAVAQPAHPLFALNRPLEGADLARHVQAVVRDSGARAPRDDGWLGAERRYTVSSFEASVALIEAGLAYAWLPQDIVAPRVAAGTLAPLPLRLGGRREVPLHLVLLRPDAAGPAAQAAVESFRRQGRDRVGAAPDASNKRNKSAK